MNTADYLAKIQRDMVQGFLHLLVLEHVRRHEPIHGYGLIKEMETAAGGAGAWKEGTVYPLLATMEKEGLIRSRWGKPSAGPRRRYYEMTPAGHEVRDLAVMKWRRLRTQLDALLSETKEASP